MELFEKELIRAQPNIRIFLDRKNIDIGSPWQPQIFESLDRCRKVVAFFSPEYLKSKVCKEEFNIAWARCREAEQEILYISAISIFRKSSNIYEISELFRLQRR
jgi:hypothetical protein